MGERNRRVAHRAVLPFHATVRCSDRLTADIVFKQGCISVMWSPGPPFPFKVTNEELDAYRSARDELIKQISREINGNVMVLEPDETSVRINVITPQQAEHDDKTYGTA